MRNQKLKIILLWTLQILLALLFLAAGSGKFMAAEVWQQKFLSWGYPNNFYLIIGVVETIAAVFLLIPNFTKYAAVFLFVVMLGAMLTHLFNQEAPELLRHAGVLRRDQVRHLHKSVFLVVSNDFVGD